MAQSSGDEKQDIETLAHKFVPMLDAFWDKRGREYYSAKHWSVNPVLLVELWMNKSLILIMATRNDQPVGFLLGTRMITFFRPETICVVDAIYGETQEIETGLVNYLDEAFQFFPERTLLLPVYEGAAPPLKNTTRQSDRTTAVYIR
jgi:hypothetical protein